MSVALTRRPARRPRRGATVGLALGVTAALALAGCGSESAASGDGPTVSIKHAQGTTEVPVKPERVAVLDLAVLDTANALDLPVTGVPKDGLPPFLSDYKGDDYADLGSMKSPDAEAVAASEPDLIIVSGRSASAYSEMSEIAPTIDLSSDETDFVGKIEDMSQPLGTIFEKEDVVEQKIDAVREQLASLKKKTANKGTGLVVLVSGGKASAFGPGSRFGAVHDAGVEPAATDLKQDAHGQAISFEFIAEKNPDWLFVIDRDAAIGEEGKAATEVLDNALVNKTTAWQQGQVLTLDGARWYSLGGGLGNATEMLKPIEAAFGG